MVKSCDECESKPLLIELLLASPLATLDEPFDEGVHTADD
ncbi:hypothetical protein PR002_g32951 [Phytophthora rubi]|uniref:Uncharacterized protein n=1 Tax=Phytophthora rubi TaxID=129364 RepID=A0A6A3G489_9STRA|nr:hypothetical protein PR002_g32951 [Phytophthora rubi]